MNEQPTIASILLDLAQDYDAAVVDREVFNRVLERRPSTAKDPYASIREKIRWESARVGWVRLGGGKIIPLHVVLQGLRFRVIPSKEEIAAAEIQRNRLLPFVAIHETPLSFLDEQGNHIGPYSQDKPIALAKPVILGDWYRRVGFAAGDSILFTITHTKPLSLLLEHEPAAAFQKQAVQDAEQALVNALADRIKNGRMSMLMPDECILPIYATASWRTAYPGRPWQILVEQDRRMRLIDGIFIADASHRTMFDQLFHDEQPDHYRQEEEQALLRDITAFQHDLLRSRQDHAAQGIWDGQAPRASTARVIFDLQAGTSTVVYLEPVNALQDHNHTIELNIAEGSYASNDWQEQILHDDMDEAFDEDDLFEELFSLSEIGDIETFVQSHPGLAEAARKLMEALTPEEFARLEQAEDAEATQHILANRLQHMLPGDPKLFSTFATYSVDTEALESENSDTNGHHGSIDEIDILEDDETDPLLGGRWVEDEDIDEEEWDSLAGDIVYGDQESARAAMDRSNDLMERFYQHLRAQGKSESTAVNRAGDLWVYADFLANYYGRALQEGDYATLDECMFFFYPRKVLNSSPRAAREMCTSIKQFYGFLHGLNLSKDDFAQAIWKRRDQAARVIELYEHIDSDSPEFERLFAYLFSPYTV